MPLTMMQCPLGRRHHATTEMNHVHLWVCSISHKGYVLLYHACVWVETNLEYKKEKFAHFVSKYQYIFKRLLMLVHPIYSKQLCGQITSWKINFWFKGLWPDNFFDPPNSPHIFWDFGTNRWLIFFSFTSWNLVFQNWVFTKK